MIFVGRSVEPAVLVKNSVSWATELRAARLLKDKDLFKRRQKKYGHVTVKTALEKMFEGKCAYCESHINVVTVGHIEHFRPKSRFISLTYAWTNLLLSCPNCNNKRHKGVKFPNVLAGGPLIDPTKEDPTKHFEFTYDAITGQALAIPITGRGQTTESIFKLNSRKALVKSRSSLIKKILALKVYEATDPTAAALILEAKNSGEPYLAWINALA